MTHILFVDDEPHVLDSLRRTLHPERERWSLHFAASGAEALELLARQDMDVVVSDIHMPGMDGIALLGHVRDRVPLAVRIVLTGISDLRRITTAAGLAHDSLRKPCDLAELRAVIVRALVLRTATIDARVRELISRVGTLPPVPRVHLELTRRLANPRSSLADVEAVIREDAGLVSAVMRLANSAYFGHAGRLTSLGGAVSVLGTNALRALALSAEVSREFSAIPAATGVSLDGARAHALATARIASSLEPTAGWREEAFVAGALHDAGLLVLAARLPEDMARVERERLASGEARESVEERVLGAHHGDVGAYLFALWGMPAGILEAASRHPRLSFGPTTSLDAVRAVALASDLAEGLLSPARPARFPARFQSDPRWPIWVDRAGANLLDFAA